MTNMKMIETKGNRRGMGLLALGALAVTMAWGGVSSAVALDVRPLERPRLETAETVAAARVAQGFAAFAEPRARVVGQVPPFAAEAAARLLGETDPLAAKLLSRRLR
ncbi:MAG: hypothetical protein AAF321_00920 [Pseudomonadota bacterium]